MSEQVFFAGDGDDVITMGDHYQINKGYGGRGDDIIYLPTIFMATPADEVNVYGGPGNDQLLPKDPFADAMGSDKARLFGGEGNDKI